MRVVEDERPMGLRQLPWARGDTVLLVGNVLVSGWAIISVTTAFGASTWRLIPVVCGVGFGRVALVVVLLTRRLKAVG